MTAVRHATRAAMFACLATGGSDPEPVADPPHGEDQLGVLAGSASTFTRRRRPWTSSRRMSPGSRSPDATQQPTSSSKVRSEVGMEVLERLGTSGPALGTVVVSTLCVYPGSAPDALGRAALIGQDEQLRLRSHRRNRGQGDELGRVVAKAALMYVVALVGLRVAHRRTAVAADADRLRRGGCDRGPSWDALQSPTVSRSPPAPQHC